MIAHENNNIADALKQYRLDHEWTLEQMASETGLHASTIHKIETGKVDPHELTLHKLKKRLPGFLAGRDRGQIAESEPAVR